MKVSQIDKAIASLESEKAIIDMAIAKLRAQQQREGKPASKKTPRKTSKGLNAGQPQNSDNGEGKKARERPRANGEVDYGNPTTSRVLASPVRVSGNSRIDCAFQS